jgi:hypothetical protein
VLNVLGSVVGTFLGFVGLLGIIGGDILAGIMIMISGSFLMPLHDPFHEVSSGVRLGGLSRSLRL